MRDRRHSWRCPSNTVPRALLFGETEPQLKGILAPLRPENRKKIEENEHENRRVNMRIPARKKLMGLTSDGEELRIPGEKTRPRSRRPISKQLPECASIRRRFDRSLQNSSLGK